VAGTLHSPPKERCKRGKVAAIHAMLAIRVGSLFLTFRTLAGQQVPGVRGTERVGFEFPQIRRSP
jgi:hypothetical protein